jgi:hypothetical protein
MRYEGRRYASVDVPAASEPRAQVAVHEPGKSSDGGWAAKLLPIFLAMFIFSLAALSSAPHTIPEAYTPFLFLLTIVSLVGTIVTFLSLR